jgi:hypothetical protein
MFGSGKSGQSTKTVYEVPAADGNDLGFRLEAGVHLPDAAFDLANKVPATARDLAGRAHHLAGRGTSQAMDLLARGGDQARNVADYGTEQAKHLRDRGSDRGHDLLERGGDAAKALSDRLPDRDTAFGWVDRLPDPIKDRANERLGRKRRSRWWTAGIMVAIVAGVAGALMLVKKAFAPGYEEEPLYRGGTEPGGAGGAVIYPTQGSGIGWPEPQRTPENTEMVDRHSLTGAAVHGDHDGNAGASPKTASSRLSTGNGASGPIMSETPSPNVPEVHISRAGKRTSATRSEQAAASGVAAAAREPAGSFYALESQGGDAALPQRSQPAQRSEVPLTEEQSEMNARLQLKQDELYAAFPAMTREDIVACDGYIDRLAQIIGPKSGTDVIAVHTRLDAILRTGPDQATNPVLPDPE